MTNDTGEKILKEGVILIGFVNGLFFYLGVSPEEAILEAFLTIIKDASPSAVPWVQLLFIFVSGAILVIALLRMHQLGGVTALIAVFLGFLAGVTINISQNIGITLLIIGALLGLFSPKIYSEFGY